MKSAEGSGMKLHLNVRKVSVRHGLHLIKYLIGDLARFGNIAYRHLTGCFTGCISLYRSLCLCECSHFLGFVFSGIIASPGF